MRTFVTALRSLLAYRRLCYPLLSKAYLSFAATFAALMVSLLYLWRYGWVMTAFRQSSAHSWRETLQLHPEGAGWAGLCFVTLLGVGFSAYWAHCQTLKALQRLGQAAFTANDSAAENENNSTENENSAPDRAVSKTPSEEAPTTAPQALSAAHRATLFTLAALLLFVVASVHALPLLYPFLALRAAVEAELSPAYPELPISLMLCTAAFALSALLALCVTMLYLRWNFLIAQFPHLQHRAKQLHRSTP